MAEGDYITSGTFTLDASEVNEYASEEVTATGASDNDIVLITPTSAYPWMNNKGGLNNVYVSDIDTNKFTVKSMYPEFKEDVTFQFIVFEGGA